MSQPRKILHVDDDPQFLRLMAAQLKPYGYEVDSLDDGRQAVQRLLDTNIRVVLLDIDMPLVNGLDLLHEIKKADGGVQVIMLTGLSTQANLLRSMRWGAAGCLFKPLESIEDCTELLDATFARIDHWWNALKELRRRSSLDSAAV